MSAGHEVMSSRNSSSTLARFVPGSSWPGRVQGQKVKDLVDEPFLDDITTAMQATATQPGHSLHEYKVTPCIITNCYLQWVNRCSCTHFSQAHTQTQILHNVVWTFVLCPCCNWWVCCFTVFANFAVLMISLFWMRNCVIDIHGCPWVGSALTFEDAFNDAKQLVNALPFAPWNELGSIIVASFGWHLGLYS